MSKYKAKNEKIKRKYFKWLQEAEGFSPSSIEGIEKEFKAQQEEFIKQQKIIRAEGEARAQDILRQTIDPLVLQKMAIEKWNGILPQATGGGGIPFIDLSKK